MMSTIKLPAHLVGRAERPQLQHIDIGETVFVCSWALQVRLDMECYLAPTALVHREKSVVCFLRVTRASEGFHVTILRPGKWEPKATVKAGLPVVSIIEDFDPDLD